MLPTPPSATLTSMDEPRIAELPTRRVVRRWYRGPRPPAPEFFTHWREFHAWARDAGISSTDPDLAMVGCEPPGVAGLRDFVYAACIPAGDEVTPDDASVEVGWLPGGRFVLCGGELTELPDLYRAAKRLATSRGLPYERGGYEFFRPLPDNAATYRVEAGYRIHD